MEKVQRFIFILFIGVPLFILEGTLKMIFFIIFTILYPLLKKIEWCREYALVFDNSEAFYICKYVGQLYD